MVVRRRQGSHNLGIILPPTLSPQFKCGTRCRDVHTLGPYGCRVALQINSCCTMPVSAAFGRACGVEWAAHARHVARAPKPKRPVVTGVATPRHRLSRRGCFCTKGSSLNNWGAGAPITALYLRVGMVPAAVPRSQHRHTESCKSNKTKQNKTLTTTTLCCCCYYC